MKLEAFLSKGLKKKKVLDIFIIVNYLFLSLDILYAHSINNFRHWGEWVPFVFCIIAFLTLTINIVLPRRIKYFVSPTVGLLSIVIGIWGVVFHLESQFFQSATLKSLIYTAPFVAPLSFSGLGFLLLLNGMVKTESHQWSVWVILLSYLGFLGNYILTLCDHAQNGFFYASEWIPVASSALLLGFIPYYIIRNRTWVLKRICHLIVGLQVFVGISGALLHGWAIVKSAAPGVTVWEQILYGAPVMAPLLYVNLAILMAIGMKAYNTDGHYLLKMNVAVDRPQ